MRRVVSIVVLVAGLFTGASGARAGVDWAAPGVLVFPGEKPAEDRPFLTLSDAGGTSLETLRSGMPRRAGKLFSGDPFTVLAIGDSVTATGPYPEILARLLEKASGNRRIRVVRAAYSGRSVDAAVRRWDKDAGAANADLALIMFGLNDQAAGAPLAAYLEQTRWLVENLRREGSAVVLLEPTPHINITPLPSDKNPPPPEASVFRTIGFAAALRGLGAELDVPVAPTFDALWGAGGDDLQAAARAMWPLFPAHYSQPFTSLAETEGQGDTIHPNAQGHLRLAQAVFATLAGRAPVAPLVISAETCADASGRLVSRLRVKNNTGGRREGRLAIYPFPQDDTHETHGYAFDKGEWGDVAFMWPVTARPGESLWLQVVDYHDGGSRAFAIPAPLANDARWLRERSVAVEPRAVARLKVGDITREVAVSWPADSEVGRVPLSEMAEVGEGKVALAAELVYTRFAAASSGEAVADGDLSEWADARWIPVGELVQARWTKGPVDHRATPAECYLHWAFKAGRESVWMAFRSTGDLAKDKFTLYFDHRPSGELGTAGPYVWIDGSLKPDGAFSLRAGDSSPQGVAGLAGRWRAPIPGEIEGELFVPYAAMNASAWPADGDLGASIVWMHAHADGRVTRLMWSENGHPWNTRWFGVVRRDPQGPLPWRTRVE